MEFTFENKEAVDLNDLEFLGEQLAHRIVMSDSVPVGAIRIGNISRVSNDF